jgi:hypothetical protein
VEVIQMTRLTDDELGEFLESQLSDVLEHRPHLEPIIYAAFSKLLARKYSRPVSEKSTLIEK